MWNNVGLLIYFCLGVYEGGLKIWECSDDLVKYLFNEFDTKLGRSIYIYFSIKILAKVLDVHVEFTKILERKVEFFYLMLSPGYNEWVP